MSRAVLLAAAVSDARQIKALDTAAIAGALDDIVVQAVAAAMADPGQLILDAEGISPLEREVSSYAFQEIVAGLWPDIVQAYRRGAGDDGKELPTLDVLLDYGVNDLTALLDSLGMAGVRENIHARSWALASRTLGQARRVLALASRGGE